MPYLIPKEFIELIKKCPEIEKSYLFAKMHHDNTGALRAHNGEPYISHPIEVALIVARWGGTNQEIQGALKHDVVEDTKVCNDEIKNRFNAEQAEINEGVTSPATKLDGNRERRVAINTLHLFFAPASSKLIKLGDIRHNTDDLHLHDPERAKTYIPEKWMQIHAVYNHNDLRNVSAYYEVRRHLLNVAKYLDLNLEELPLPYKISIPDKICELSH